MLGAQSTIIKAQPNAKALGFITTPISIVRFLTRWAVRTPGARVLDAGLGDGRFLAEAARRLIALGATQEQAAQQLYGVELDPVLFQQAVERVSLETGREVSNLYSGNFLDCPSWRVESVIGNPPYVRRHHIQEIDRWLHALPGRLPRMTDLSALFVYKATQLLVPGGRLAVIMSSGWLDQAYGREFRAYLLEHYSDVTVVGFGDRVFPDALVKPIALLGLRRVDAHSKTQVHVTTYQNEAGVPSEVETEILNSARDLDPEEFSSQINLSSQLYLPEAHPILASHGLAYSQLGQIAALRIGFQSFSKGFFLLERQDLCRLGLSSDDVRPIVLSPRFLPDSLLLRPEDVTGRVFWAKTLEDLSLSARWYLMSAESQEVPVRGKGFAVRGYQNAPRAMRTSRSPWFNVATELQRRGGAPILLPRRTFVRFRVVHNPAEIPATEHFLEIRPNDSDLVTPLLVYLNSTFGELATRLASHQYGGGVFNLNPGQARKIALPDLTRLARCNTTLEITWTAVRNTSARSARASLDDAVVEALEIPADSLSAARHLVTVIRDTAERFAHPRAEKEFSL
ncbi:MAG: N-6 DNA methylase [Dehalococcoidia bacterium]|nr:N-6 DNA methylase [Dehalococcoidia bacterium]